MATCTVWLAIDDANIENGCLRFIKGSHKDKKLKTHNINNNKKLTLNQELDKTEYNEKDAVDLTLKGDRFLYMMFIWFMDPKQTNLQWQEELLQCALCLHQVFLITKW